MSTYYLDLEKQRREASQNCRQEYNDTATFKSSFDEAEDYAQDQSAYRGQGKECTLDVNYRIPNPKPPPPPSSSSKSRRRLCYIVSSVVLLVFVVIVAVSASVSKSKEIEQLQDTSTVALSANHLINGNLRVGGDSSGTYPPTSSSSWSHTSYSSSQSSSSSSTWSTSQIEEEIVDNNNNVDSFLNDFFSEDNSGDGDGENSNEENRSFNDDPSCAAHPTCASGGLVGDCCPTPEGIALGCCEGVTPLNEGEETDLIDEEIENEETITAVEETTDIASSGNINDEIEAAATNDVVENSAAVTINNNGNDSDTLEGSNDNTAATVNDLVGVDNKEKYCEAHSRCAALRLTGECCPTPEGIILGCCDGIVPIATTATTRSVPLPLNDLP